MGETLAGTSRLLLMCLVFIDRAAEAARKVEAEKLPKPIVISRFEVWVRVSR